MTTAQEILKLIETCNPDDRKATFALNESVYEWLLSIDPETKYGNYVLSRDALKKIRPEGWTAFSMDFYGAFSDIRFWKCELGKPGKMVASVGLPTEELAELHAIIQAIEHERTQEAVRDIADETNRVLDKMPWKT